MLSLVIGVAALACSWLMLWVARPQPDGRAAPFLEASGLTTLYALAITALVGMGAVLVIAGAGALALSGVSGSP